jgi:hypothetical protein
MKTQAIDYQRFSTDQQGDGSSFERQEADIKKLCLNLDFERIFTIKDAGVSGGGDHIRTGNLGKFLNEADAGKYRGCAFVVEDLDRLSRMGIYETQALIQRMWNAGLTIHLSRTGRVIAPGDDVATAVTTVVESWNAADKRRQMKGYAINGAAKRLNAMLASGVAINGLLPAWLKVADGKVVEVTKAEGTGKMKKIPAATVRRIFELAAEGYGARTILENLNGSANGLSPAWVNKTLASRAPLGEFKSSKLSEPVHDYYPQIVDVDLYRRARAQIEAKNGMDHNARVRACAGRNSDSNLFYKLAWDVTNDEQFRMNRKAPYFMTSHRAGKGRVHQIRYDWFEKAFRVFIRTNIDWQNVITQGKPEELQAAESDQTKLANTVAALRSQIASKTALFEKAVGNQEEILLGVIGGLHTKLANAETALNAVTATVNELKAKLANLESPERLFELLDAPDNADIRRKLKAEISKVVSRIDLEWCEYKGQRWVSLEVRFINGVEHVAALDPKTGELLGLDFNMQADRTYEGETPKVLGRLPKSIGGIPVRK